MIQELLYTSYEGKGLRAGGGGGYCSVLGTAGMAANLAQTLERLSGYKHPFDVHDARAAQSPVNYRHAIVVIGGQTYHVLSRIANEMGEHTGRSNKLAHHLALPREDAPIGGPSWVLADAKVCRREWDQKAAAVPAISPATLPQDNLPYGPCRAWQRAAGDAGWAGVVAETLLAGDNATVSIIYPLGTDALELVHEALSLVPPERRWDVTFSTYYTTALPYSSCHLRMLLDGTPEAETLRRDYRQKTIDLTTKLGPAGDTELTRAARSGEVKHPAPRAARRRGQEPIIPLSPAHTAAVGPLSELPAADDEFELESATSAGSGNAGRLRRGLRSFGQPARSGNARPRQKAPWKTMAIVVLAASVMLLLVAIGAGVYLVARHSSSTAEIEAKAQTTQSADEVVDLNNEGSKGRSPTPTASAPPAPTVNLDDAAPNQQVLPTSDAKESADALPTVRENAGLAEKVSIVAGDATDAREEISEKRNDIVTLMPAVNLPLLVEGGGFTKTIAAIPDGVQTLYPPAPSKTSQSVDSDSASKPLLGKVQISELVGGTLIQGTDDALHLSGRARSDGGLDVFVEWKDSGVTGNKKWSASIGSFSIVKGFIKFEWNLNEIRSSLKAADRLAAIKALRHCIIVVQHDARQLVMPLVLATPINISVIKQPVVERKYASSLPKDKCLCLRVLPVAPPGIDPTSTFFKQDAKNVAGHNPWALVIEYVNGGPRQTIFSTHVRIDSASKQTLRLTTTSQAILPFLPIDLEISPPTKLEYKPHTLNSESRYQSLSRELPVLIGVIEKAISAANIRKGKLDEQLTKAKDDDPSLKQRIADCQSAITSLQRGKSLLEIQQIILPYISSLELQVLVDVSYDLNSEFPAIPLLGETSR